MITIATLALGVVVAVLTVVLARRASRADREPAEPVDAPITDHPEPESREPAAEYPVQRLRLLVVDDEPLVGQMITRLLPAHDVVAVTTGAAALATLASDARFDAILCDMMMPGMSGAQLAAAISERHDGLQSRIIFMTATADAERLVYRSDVRWVAKPLHYAQLASCISDVVEASRRSADRRARRAG